MKKRTILRSAAALTLAIVMLLALALPALAAGSGSITINPNGQEGLGDAGRFTAYQVFKGDVNKDNTDELDNLEWGDNVDGNTVVNAMKAATNLPLGESNFGAAFTKAYDEDYPKVQHEVSQAEFVAQWLAAQKGDIAAPDFARIVAGCLAGSGKNSTLDSSNNWVINGLDPGYYLVKDNYVSQSVSDKSDGSVSSYILQVVGEVSVDLKATIPTVEKKIISDGKPVDGVLSETETDVTYRLTGTVAENIGQYSAYEYIFTDTLSAGLSMTAGNVRSVQYVNDTTTVGTFTKDTDYEVKYVEDPDHDGVHILTITFKDLIASLKTLHVDVGTLTAENIQNIKIVIEYTAHLNEQAVIGTGGNPNSVVLTYSNDPYETGTGKSAPDEVNTFTLALRIIKNGVDGPLKDVGFKLMKGKSNTPTTGLDNSYARFELVTTPTETYQEIAEWVKGPIESTGTELKTDTNGVINIHGLSVGAYTLVETNAPDGYETMKPIVFNITGEVENDGTLDVDDVKLKRDESNENREDVKLTNDDFSGHKAELTLTNFKSPILPHTGGIGAKVVYIVSGLTVLAGAAIVVMAMRKRTRGRHEQSR